MENKKHPKFSTRALTSVFTTLSFAVGPLHYASWPRGPLDGLDRYRSDENTMGKSPYLLLTRVPNRGFLSYLFQLAPSLGLFQEPHDAQVCH